jgi:hypothetical protein
VNSFSFQFLRFWAIAHLCDAFRKNRVERDFAESLFDYQAARMQNYMRKRVVEDRWTPKYYTGNKVIGEVRVEPCADIKIDHWDGQTVLSADRLL